MKKGGVRGAVVGYEAFEQNTRLLNATRVCLAPVTGGATMLRESVMPNLVTGTLCGGVTTFAGSGVGKGGRLVAVLPSADDWAPLMSRLPPSPQEDCLHARYQRLNQHFRAV